MYKSLYIYKAVQNRLYILAKIAIGEFTTVMHFLIGFIFSMLCNTYVNLQNKYGAKQIKSIIDGNC